MITLIHPSRSRPQKSFETMKKWILKAGMKDLEIIVSLDNDDPAVGQYQELYLAKGLPHPCTLIVGENKNAVGAINRAARISQGTILIVVSDDTSCPANWGNRILRYTAGRTDFVLKTQDGIQPKMITMPITDRIYYQRDGYIYHPNFSHCWADRHFTEIAHKRGRVITKNIMFRHLHYSVTKEKPDAQYRRTDATFNEGKRIYKQLMAEK